MTTQTQNPKAQHYRFLKEIALNPNQARPKIALETRPKEK